MKVNRDMVARAGLELLNEVGLEQLTLRLLAARLKIQAPTVYWHFKSKVDLIDEMATTVLSEGAPRLVPAKESADWTAWAAAFGGGLRKTLLEFRDGARMVVGSRLTNSEFIKTMERVGARLVDQGFTVRQTVVLLSTIYNYTLSFVMEEQAVFPRRNKRSPKYDVAARNAKLDAKQFPIMRQSGNILFDKFDRRFREGLELILSGVNEGRDRGKRQRAVFRKKIGAALSAPNQSTGQRSSGQRTRVR
jgi:TetR/AcrR family tetracycline transcriptional repressor